MRRHLLTLMASTFFLAGFGMAANAQQGPGSSMMPGSPMPGGSPMMQGQTPQAQTQQTQPQTIGHSYRDDDDDDCDDYHGRRMMHGWMRDRDRGYRRGWMHDRDEGRGWMRNRGGGPRGMSSGMGFPAMGGPVMMRMMMAIIDADGDGTVSLQEFQAAHERMFKALDANKDGRLTPEELQNFMSGATTPAQQQ